VSCGGGVIKIVLFVFNALWVACGAAIVYLGVRVLLKYNVDVADVSKETPSHSAIVLITAGGLIFLISFLGCCGAIKESYCMLNTYGGLIFVCLAAQGVGAYLAIKYQYDLENYAVKGINSALEAYDWMKPDNEPGNRAINEFQKQLKCCGGKEKEDWDILTKQGHIKGQYPASCCENKNNLVDNRCPAVDAYNKGCVEAMIDYLKLYIGGLGYIAIGVVLVELLVLISACCLARDIKGRYASYAAPKGRA